MTQLYVVGGASRCGKSSVLRRFLERHGNAPLATISTDDVLNALWRDNAGQYEAYPELMQQVTDNEDGMDPATWIDFQQDTTYLVRRQHEQSRAVWNMRLGKAIHKHLETSDVPLLAEGIALLPDLIRPLSHIATVRAVYLGNESPSHANALIGAARAARSPEENWMHGLSDEQIRAYMQPKEAMSRRIGEMATENGFAYVDMGQGDFTTNVDRVIDILVKANS